MLTPIRTRSLGLLGLAGMLPLAWGLVQGTLSLDQAALRAGVLLGLLALVEHFVLPLVQLVLGPPNRRSPERAPSSATPEA